MKERIERLVENCPESCKDVTPVCPKSPPPPPPLAVDLTSCTDDPTYVDFQWGCSAWASYTKSGEHKCSDGFPPVNTPEKIKRLMQSCPQSCSDVHASCPPPPP